MLNHIPDLVAWCVPWGGPVVGIVAVIANLVCWGTIIHGTNILFGDP